MPVDRSESDREVIEHRVHSSLAPARLRLVTVLARLPELAQNVFDEALQVRRRNRLLPPLGSYSVPALSAWGSKVTTAFTVAPVSTSSNALLISAKS